MTGFKIDELIVVRASLAQRDSRNERRVSVQEKEGKQETGKRRRSRNERMRK